jgi:hypothetical protein
MSNTNRSSPHCESVGIAAAAAANTVTESCAASAGSPVTGVPPTVADTALDVLVKRPGEAVSGIETVTVKLQDAPGASVPPVNVSSEVPVSCEPEPQGFVSGVSVATIPGRAASRSSVNVIPVADARRSVFVMVKLSVVVPP